MTKAVIGMWWQTGVIYQIYPRSFADSDGDGIGDLAGIIPHLDYLTWLGVNAIWLSPIFPSPMKDFGYDVSNYVDIHPDYGDLVTFDALLTAAHERDLKILLDLVPNHTSDQHEWFIEARSSRDNPKRDWYIWKDPAPNGGPPNNWESYFGGPAWTFDEATEQYYLHNFDPSQPELNWRNPEVEQAMFDVIRFWLGRGVDGFRIDVIDRIIKDAEFRDNPVNPKYTAQQGFGAAPLSRLYSEQRPEVHDYIKRFRQVFDAYDGVIVGELAYNLPPEKIARYYGGPGSGTGDEIHLPFNFGLVILPWRADDIREFVDEYDAALPEYGWPNYALGNHDTPRILSRYGAAQARIAAMLLLTLRGTPTIYNGDEIGMANTPVPLDRIQDPQGRNQAGFNRDECRAPMQWDDSQFAGFSPDAAPDARMWLPVSPDYETVNVAAQEDAPDSLLRLYQRLLAYRARNPVLQTGRYRSLGDVTDGCFAYVRENDTGERRLIVLNFMAEAIKLSLDVYAEGTIALSTDHERDGTPLNLKAFMLRPNEGLIIEI